MLRVNPELVLTPYPLTATDNSSWKTLQRQNTSNRTHYTPTTQTWTSHDKTLQKFISYFIIDVQTKTLPKTLQLWFYVFKDATCPNVLLSYPSPEILGTVEFKVLNETPTTAALDTISSTSKASQNVTPSASLQTDTLKPQNNRQQTPK